jgi:SPP1 family predicted phage head-tail adaptor
MRAGDLRHRVTFQQRATGDDARDGAQLTTWVDVLASVPVAISPLNGRELMAAKAVQSEVSHQIDLRYHPLLANPKEVAAMRIVFGTRVFNIHSATTIDERRREMRILAEEGLNDG